MYPVNLRYTKEHEWINQDGMIGVTYYAQHELGDVVFAELPKSGKEIKKGEELCVLESVKAVSNVYSPVSGKVSKINEKLSKEPELINNSPYAEGWIAVVSMSDDKELKNMMDSEEYKKYINELHSNH